MKTLLLFAIITALAAWAGAFFEMWTIPRFERLPTVSDYATRGKSLEEAAGRAFAAEPVRPTPPPKPAR